MAASTLPPLRRGTAATGNFMSFLCPFSSSFVFPPFFYLYIFSSVVGFPFFFAPGVLRTLSRAVFGAGSAHPGQAFPLKVWRRWWMRGRDTLRRRLVEVLVMQLS